MLSLFDPYDLVRYLQVALGIGLVIFVHEAGHFFAARMCRVRVETFSLGFGPRLFGWKRGPTTYQIAAVPLGGYVKMAGEDRLDDAPPAPDDLRAKSVGQRFFIYSGGVLMNIVFGLVVFPIVLSVGVPFREPVVREPEPGGPAWQARLAAGTRFLKVNGEPAFSFDSIINEVALSESPRVQVEILDPGAQTPREIHLDAVYVDRPGIFTIGVRPAFDPKGRILVERGSPADRAGLKTDDRLVGFAGLQASDPLHDQLFMAMLRGEQLSLEIERDGQLRTVELAPELPPAKGPPRLGVEPAARSVRALRDNPHVAALGLAVGDRVIAVAGTPMVREADFERALLACLGEGEGCSIEVRRGQAELALTVPPLQQHEATALAADVALAIDEESTAVAVRAGTAAADAGLRDGDVIVRVGETPVHDWKQLQEEIKRAKAGEPLAIAIQRRSPSGEAEYLSLVAHPAPRSEPLYGFGLLEAMYTYQAKSPAEAVHLGMKSTWKFTRDSWETLRGIFRGSVSSEVMGGIISIGTVSYDWASMGLARLFFFLCMLSINLAFINVLPIPVLDGGHLFFLLVEKIKGSPVSERVQGYSQMVGLVMIVSLMIYVTYNDIRRLFEL